MGDRFFGNDDGFDFDDGFDDDGSFGDWPSPFPGPPGPPGPGGRGFKPNNDRYSNAYANYRGGYGPGGGFGPPMGPRPFRPPGPPGPPGGPIVMWGRGFGPGGPPMQRNISPENQAFRYLLRCGLSKEVVKSVPKRMLRIMEPEYCGVCAMEFDSFAMSRMHYTSRNHAKNQKKWIAQNSHFGETKKEIPLKSRDLYCELCDVHITSTTHAESHYAGKPHRGIVERRKNPKNPYLLQRGMENRVEQLIRREKKFMKLAPKVEQEPLEARPFQPELYCDICKTSVTCSEQMTLHLNGKRHLSKEKQHIIRVMNGTAEAEKTGESAPEEVPEEEPEEETEEGPEEAPQEGPKDAEATEENKPAEQAGDDGAEWETWEN